MKRVVVIGGGLAGIAAALECANAGASVSLLEARGRLGGAAYSFTRNGILADNGQHVFLRCCTAYRELLGRIGAEQLTVMQPRLSIPVLGPGGARSLLRRTSLPAPLHLAGALVRFRFLSPSQRLSVALAMTALRRVDPDDPAADARSFGDWLTEHGQSREAVETVWELIGRPTLNLRAHDASLAQAAYVFQQGLLRDPAAGDIGYARVPLGEIHDAAARRALDRAGVEVRLRRSAAAIETDGTGLRVLMSGASTLSADAVVLAVPPDRACRLAPPESALDGSRLRSLGTSPIVNLHVVYDRRVLDLPFAAGVGTPVQWVFDRTAASGLEEGQYLAVSLSAADAELDMSADELRERFLPAIAELLPAARHAHARHVLRHARARRHVPRLARRPRAAPGTADGAPRAGAGRSLDRHRLAGDDGRRGTQRADGGESRAGHGQRSARISPRRWRHEWTHRACPPVSGGACRARRSSVGPRSASRDGPSPGSSRRSCGRRRPAPDRRLLRRASTLISNPATSCSPASCAGPTGTMRCPDPTILAGVLRRGGLRVRVGPIASSQRLVVRERRRTLRRTGALAVDMESAWLAAATRAQPLVTLRVVLDTHRQELYRPFRTVVGAAVAYRTLRRASALAESWARALRPREVVLASPRASCAGVVRAVEIVERALEDRGAPIYVRKQIVHNAHVVAELEQRGAIFVEEVDEVPAGSAVIFSAHGVSPAVRAAAAERGLDVIDATCPLVSKVHAEARRFAQSGAEIVLVGHEGHEEVEGTFGEAPEHMHVIASPEDVGRLEVKDPDRVAYLTQTTLAIDETEGVVDALRRAFPGARPDPPRATSVTRRRIDRMPCASLHQAATSCSSSGPATRPTLAAWWRSRARRVPRRPRRATAATSDPKGSSVALASV